MKDKVERKLKKCLKLYSEREDLKKEMEKIERILNKAEDIRGDIIFAPICLMLAFLLLGPIFCTHGFSCGFTIGIAVGIAISIVLEVLFEIYDDKVNRYARELEGLKEKLKRLNGELGVDENE